MYLRVFFALKFLKINAGHNISKKSKVLTAPQMKLSLLAVASPLLHKENPALLSLWCKTAVAHTSGQTFNYLIFRVLKGNFPSGASATNLAACASVKAIIVGQVTRSTKTFPPPQRDARDPRGFLRAASGVASKSMKVSSKKKNAALRSRLFVLI